MNQTHPRPTDEATKQDLEVYDARVMAIICSALDEHHYGSVIHCETSNEIWKTLISMRESNTSTTKLQLRRELTNYKFRENQQMTEYLSGLNIIVSKLKTAGINVDDEEIISKILDELPRQFEMLKQNYQMTSIQGKEQDTIVSFTKILLDAERNLKRHPILCS